MKSSCHFLVLIIVFSVFTWIKAIEPSDELKIVSLFTPEYCSETRLSIAGDNITVHYSGWVDESSPVGDAGEMFDSSRIKDVPFSFQIGAGDVIGGWDQGLLGMCIGEKRRLTIPPSLGYGSDGIGIIPGGAVLRFEVECIDIKDPVPLPPQNIFLEMDIDLSNTLTVEEFTQWFYDNAYPNADESHHYFLFEDKNRDGLIQWEEFSGPKGDVNPADVKEDL